MKTRLAQLSLSLLLALGVVADAHAQALPGKRDQAVLPVWNQSSGKVEALLLLEPAGSGKAFDGNALDAAFGIDAGNSLGVFCDRKTGLASALGNLANNCMLASFGDRGDSRTGGTTAFRAGDHTRVGLSAGTGTSTLPAWLTSPGGRGNGATVDVNDLTVFAQQEIGRQGMVSIAGTMARATLVTPAEATSLGIGDAWTSRSLSVGGGYGRFSANVVGHVVETPGQPRWEGLGVGLTWRTPWSGQLTVGADNLVTKGRNPFAPALNGRDDEGTVPYIRYEQDL